MKRQVSFGLCIVLVACAGNDVVQHDAMQPVVAPVERVQPHATLQPDEFDAAVQVPAAEAAKTGGESGVESHVGLYACPMQPEVTSETPGTCPKCGMALVKKEKQ